MNPHLSSIINSDKSSTEKELLIEELMNIKIAEAIREERKIDVSVNCPMCMAEMNMHAEISFGNLFLGMCSCKGCKRSFSVHGDRTTKVTRIIPAKETSCTVSEQLRLSGT